MIVGDQGPVGALPPRPVIVTVFNQKGGVGKTTTAVNVAVCMAAFGRRVALIDLDSQSNATANLGVPPPVATGAYHLLTGQVPFADCLRDTPFDNLRLVGGSDELAWADVELSMGTQPEAELSTALAASPADLDAIVIDCPPAPGIVSVNALVAADLVVMPVMPSPHALDGLHKAWWNVNRVRSHFKRDLGGLHILLTMTEDGTVPTRLAADILAEFGSRVMPVMVPRDGSVIEAASRDLPVAVLASGSAPGRAYVRVTELLLDPDASDLQAREAVRARLSLWRNQMVDLPSHRDPYADTGPAPAPAWTEDVEEDEPDDEEDGDAPQTPLSHPVHHPGPPRPASRLGTGLALVAVGMLLGAAVTVAVLLGLGLRFPT